MISELLVGSDQESEVPPYMEDFELLYTDLCHPGELELLKGVLAEHPGLRRHGMLDAGCGDGRFLEFWADRYGKVDMFDQSDVARGKVEAKIEELALGEDATVLRSSFIEFPW